MDAVSISLDHHDGLLGIDITVTPGTRTRPGWQPEAMFEDARDGHGTVMADSVGPMIAWGLARLMSGTIAISKTEPGDVTLKVQVPALAVDGSRDRVRVISRSSTSDLLIRTALDSADLAVWETTSDPERVAAVLYESSGAEEGVIVAQLRAAHPGARIIGLGDVKKSAYFDGYGDIPPDPAALRGLIGKSDRAAGSA